MNIKNIIKFFAVLLCLVFMFVSCDKIDIFNFGNDSDISDDGGEDANSPSTDGENNTQGSEGNEDNNDGGMKEQETPDGDEDGWGDLGRV